MKQTAKRKAPKTAWKPGQSGNPGGRPRVASEIRDLARQYCEESVEILRSIQKDATNSPQARALAAREMLDRGIGKATQSIELTAQLGPLEILILPSEKS